MRRSLTLGLVHRLAEERRFVGRVQIGRRGIELGRATVDALEYRAERRAAAGESRTSSSVIPPVIPRMALWTTRAARSNRLPHAPFDVRGPKRQLRKPGIGKAHRL